MVLVTSSNSRCSINLCNYVTYTWKTKGWAKTFLRHIREEHCGFSWFNSVMYSTFTSGQYRSLSVVLRYTIYAYIPPFSLLMLLRQSTWHSSLRKAVFILIHNLKVSCIVVVWGIERQSCCIFTEEAEGDGCWSWACFLSLIHSGTSAQIQFPPM